MSAAPTFDLALDLAWKSAAVAAVVLTAAGLLRSRPAAERVALLRLGVVVVFALPLLTLLAPALRIQMPDLTRFEPVRATVPGPVPNRVPIPAPLPNTAPIPGLPAAAPARSAAAPAAALPRVSPQAMIAAVWLTGVAALLLRLLGGVAALALWSRRAAPVTDPRWRTALDRAVAGGRHPGLKVSSRIASPLSWGWPGGVVLIDEATLSRPDRADAVLTHEMGHIRHHDWPFLMLSHVLVAVLWFNPFIWRLQRELTRQSEQAADAWAVRRIDRADYADALVAMARAARPHAALGMAGPPSDLARRVTAVLDTRRGKGRPWSTAAAAVACLGLAGPLAALEWAPGALPAALHPKAAATPRPVPATAAAVVALLPDALTSPAADAPSVKNLSPEAMAALIRQRDRGLAMFEAGARAMEGAAAQIHRQMHFVSTEEERADMLREAENLAGEAAGLRAQARDLAARDPSTLRPMNLTEEREMEIELGKLLALPAQMQMQMQMPVGADVAMNTDARSDVQIGFAPPPPAPHLEEMAAGMREGAGKMRADAARMDAEASRIRQDRSAPPDAVDQIESLREQADALRQQADDMDQQAADVMSG